MVLVLLPAYGERGVHAGGGFDRCEDFGDAIGKR
jgi:hypothetical protein